MTLKLTGAASGHQSRRLPRQERQRRTTSARVVAVVAMEVKFCSPPPSFRRLQASHVVGAHMRNCSIGIGTIGQPPRSHNLSAALHRGPPRGTQSHRLGEPMTVAILQAVAALMVGAQVMVGVTAAGRKTSSRSGGSKTQSRAGGAKAPGGRGIQTATGPPGGKTAQSSSRSREITGRAARAGARDCCEGRPAQGGTATGGRQA